MNMVIGTAVDSSLFFLFRRLPLPVDDPKECRDVIEFLVSLSFYSRPFTAASSTVARVVAS